MNILILGATGRVGGQIVTYALRDRHRVTVLVRTPEKIKINNENLTIIQGNVLNKDDIVRAIHGIDVVISALNTDGTTTLSESMPLIIEAMENEGVKTNNNYRNCRYSAKVEPRQIRCVINQVNQSVSQPVQRKNIIKFTMYSSNQHSNGRLSVLRIYRMEKV
ncbi:hypothetical protein GCM10020331_000890 [Ectobacillus funiculus]